MIVKRRSLKKPDEVENEENENDEADHEESGELEDGEASNTPSKDDVQKEASAVKRGLSDDEEEEADADDNEQQTPVADDTFVTPMNQRKKRKLIMPPVSDHGSTSFSIPGTPIVTMNDSGVEKVPDWTNFSKDICDHKPFEMDPGATPTGNFRKIIEITSQFKQQNESNSGDHNSSFSTGSQ
jgi:hypothetical protein